MKSANIPSPKKKPTKMILYINTASDQAELVLQKNEELIRKEFTQFPHSEEFAAEIKKFLATVKVQLTDLQKIAVKVGPGFFSKIRTGVVAANGLAYGLQIPIVAVTGEPNFTRIAKQKGERMVAPIYNAEPTITMPKKRKNYDTNIPIRDRVAQCWFYQALDFPGLFAADELFTQFRGAD